MNILQIVQSACLSLDLERPQSLFSSTDRTWQEMGDCVNTALRQIVDEYDWQKLIRTAVITGNGVATAFPLPDDFSRMVKDASLIGQNWIFYPAMMMDDFNQWLEMLNYPVSSWQQKWMIFGGNVNVIPVLPNAQTLTYGYISENAVNSNGSAKAEFTMDTDTFALDDELLRLAIIWNWKQAKGYDFQAELAKYQERYEKQRFRDVGSPQTLITGGWRRNYGRGFV